MIELINKIKERLTKYDLTFEKFKEYTLLLNITTPKKLAKFYNNLNSEQTFYLIAIVVFNQCDLLTGQKASFLEQKNYSEWEKRVGEKRAENFKLAVFEEIKFRIFSNSFPEFANQQDIMNPIFSVRGENKEYKIISQILSPQSANFIINSHWNLLDFEGAQDYIKNFQEYLDKFVYKPFYRDLGALRALLLAKEMVLRTEIGEVMNMVSRHYAEFIFNKQIQEQYNKNIKQNIKELAELLEAKEIAILAKIADVKDELNTEVSALKSKDNEQDGRLLVIEDVHIRFMKMDIDDLKHQDESFESQIKEINRDLQNHNTLIISNTSKHDRLKFEFDNYKNQLSDDQRIQNEKIENNENELNEHINTSTATIMQLRNDFDFFKEEYRHHKDLFLTNDQTNSSELSRFQEFVYKKFNELGANNSNSTTNVISSGTSTNTINLPSDVLTESNLNSKIRELSGLTIVPGNGTDNSSFFLKNNKANWEFYADVYSGAFGVWDKLRNRNAFSISTERKVDFYNDINAHGYKVTNIGEPVANKDAANKNYVDLMKANLETSLTTIRDKVAILENNSTAWNEKPSKEYVDDINNNLTNNLTELKNKIAEISDTSVGSETPQPSQWQYLIQDVKNDFYDYFDIDKIENANLGRTKTALLKIKYVDRLNNVCYGFFDLTNFWNSMLESESIDFMVTLFHDGQPYYDMIFTMTFVLSLDAVKLDVRRVEDIDNGRDLEGEATCSIWLLRK